MIGYVEKNVNPKGRKTGDYSTRALDGTTYTVSEMDKILTKKQLKEDVLVTVANHHTCITGGHIQDIWNCGYKTVGNYYAKR